MSQINVKAVLIVFLGIALAMIAIAPVHAQGSGYTIVTTPPQPGMHPLSSRFYMTVFNASTQVEETILCGVAGFVVWSPDLHRAPDYLILRIDNLMVLDDYADPLNAYGPLKPGITMARFIPTDQLPLPTIFIFGQQQIDQWDVHAPHLP